MELQLAEDAREVTLDRPCGDEECLGDLAVAEALAGELGDPTLAGRQRIEAFENGATWTRTGGAELGLGVRGERSRARAECEIECLAQQLPRFGPAITAPNHGSEISERARAFQARVTTLA